MSVHFVYRCHYEGPSEKYIKRFDSDTLLAWFQRHWDALSAADGDRAHDQAEAILGTFVYGFATLGNAIAEHDLPAPATVAELGAILEEHLYVEGEILLTEHCLQVITDDDELQMAYFFFDDLFLRDNGERAEYLLHADWRLPLACEGEPDFAPAVEGTEFASGGSGAGQVWVCLLAYYDSGNLDDLEGPRVIPGIRLGELPVWLLQHPPSDDWSWPLELRLLRSQLLGPPASADAAADADEAVELDLLRDLQRRPDDHETWAVYSDWLLGRGQPRSEVVVLQRALERCAGLPVATITNSISWKDRCRGDLQSAQEDAAALVDEAGGVEERGLELSRLSVGEHIAQLSLFTAEWNEGKPMFHQWVLFDDVWAGNHPALANGLLRFAARWDVLSGDQI
jgi:uncharacterized protein (TIGR02996 family)